MGSGRSLLPIHTVIIKVTNECNLRCTYCFVEPSAPRKVRISESLVRCLLDQLEAYSTEPKVHLVWHGGEPTLVDVSFFGRMKEMQSGRTKAFENFLQTNGTLLTDAYVRTLKALDFHVGLSLDGPLEVNDQARVDKQGNGTFVRAMQAMQLLKRHEVPFGMLATVARHNIEAADQLYRFCKEHEVPLKLSPLYHSGQAQHHFDSLAIAKDEFAHFTNRLASCWLNDTAPVKIDPIEPLLVNTLGGTIPIGCAFSKKCHHHFLGVGPTGDLYPCGLFQGYHAFCYGNICTTRLNVLAASRVFHLMDERGQAIAEHCASCCIFEHCYGGCPFHALVNAGSIHERTPLCYPYKRAVGTIIDALSRRLSERQESKSEVEP